MYPVPTKNAERLSNYNTLNHKLDFSDLTLFVKVSDIAKFERKNNVSIHLYGCDKDKRGKQKPYTLQMSWIVNTEVEIERRTRPTCTIDLLYVENAEGNSHYYWMEVGNKMKGSGWIFKMVNKAEVQISQYVPLMGCGGTPPYLLAAVAHQAGVAIPMCALHWR